MTPKPVIFKTCWKCSKSYNQDKMFYHRDGYVCDTCHQTWVNCLARCGEIILAS
jgi:hypothetical protein